MMSHNKMERIKPKEFARLQGKSAIVTGAANGIGCAIAQLFAEEGASVLIADIDEKNGLETAKEITDSDGQAVFVRCDVTKPDDVKSMVATAVEKFGAVNILVNNAVAFIFGKVEDVSQEDWHKVFEVNVIGYANCVKEILPFMREAGGGAIVNLASVSSFIAQPAFVPYNASKAAVLEMTRCLAMDLAPDNIRVNAICPGTIKTQITERHAKFLGLDPKRAYKQFGDAALLKRIGTPREVAYGALFLASNEASYITGTQLVIDGGASSD